MMRTLAALVVSLPLAAAPAADAANYVPNPGFESCTAAPGKPPSLRRGALRAPV
jgi:hypothetical protein